MMRGQEILFWSLVCIIFLPACTYFSSGPAPASEEAKPVASASQDLAGFDTETQTLIAQAERVVFVIPFSHWDTDWHETFADYAKRSDQNILKAIQLAHQYPRFRYTLEQPLFVQHFWGAYPEYRAALKALVKNRQLSFAWGGLTQPETSLVAPAIQRRNLQLGQAWIAETFGPASAPRTAWQSDAFGNSAAFPIFLSQAGIPYLYIGRWQDRCDPDYNNCQPLPHAFYWTSPIMPQQGDRPARVLVTYLSYPTGWAAIRRPTDEAEQLARLRKIVEDEFKRTTSPYIFLPVGFDFLDPLPNLPALVESWNAADQRTVLVMADPDTAFQYLATQALPEITTDLNPIWQAFYGSRPQAKIADKESEYFLTAADKFGLLLDIQPTGWLTASINAHYDNVAGVGYDPVWANSQRPRFEQTVAVAKDELATILARLASGVSSPVVIFNPTSWPRSEVIELAGDLPELSQLPAPVQRLGPHAIAFQAKAVPPVGFAVPTKGSTTVANPATLTQVTGRVTLANGLVSVTLDPAHGGAFTSLALSDRQSTAQPVELLTTFGDDVTYFEDKGDIYGASFGSEQARESHVPAQITVLAAGPLLARAQVAFTLGDRPLTKTVTLRAGSPLIEVTLDVAAPLETTALAQTSTILTTTTRTDDLGFAAFEHPVDSRPIVPGDITYRRDIFYPIIYWSDVSLRAGVGSTTDLGLTLITHGLQGVGGTGALSFMLVRSAPGDGDDGLTDTDYHTLRYAYLPHYGTAAAVQPWLAAYAFNQPLIPVWRSGSGSAERLNVQLPFGDSPPRQFKPEAAAPPWPTSLSLISAESGLVADLYHREQQLEALVLDYDPASPATLHFDQKEIRLKGAWLTVVPVELTAKTVN
jgi:hypothetical protein